MFKYIICIIFMITNIYISDINLIPVSVIVNCLIITILLLVKYKITIRTKYLYLLIIILLAAITSLLNGSIYYIYIISRNIVFLITLLFIYHNIESEKISKSVMIVVNINNLIIFGMLLNIPVITSFAYQFATFSGFDIRFDYRMSGILSGTLKASFLSCYAFLYNLYYVKNNLIKIPYAFILLLFMFIQSRSSLVLSFIIIFLYVIHKIVIEKNLGLNIKKGFITVSILVVVLLGLFTYKEKIIGLLPHSESTIIWQFSGLMNLNKSDSILWLQTENRGELSRFQNSATNFSTILFGNGQGNWRGQESIKTDCGFVVQLIGLGLLGSMTLNLFYVIGFASLLRKYFQKCNNESFLIIFSIVIIDIYMNYKSTSFIGFDYFNLFFIFLSIICLKQQNKVTRS